MNIQKLADRFYKINKKLYKEAKNPLRSHGPDHHLRVWKNASKIAKKFDDIDYEVLIPACFLHDISAYYPDEVGDNDQEEDTKKAKFILDQINFNQNKILAVLDAISSHGSDAKYKNKRKSIESIILCDADKLDVFGALGIARIIMVKTLRGATLKDIVKDFYYNGHLERKWEALTLKETKNLARKQYEYALNFFKNLARKLGK